MRILVVSAHMDDEVLGVGGTIARHVDCGEQVTVCILANRAYNHEYDEEMIRRQKQAAIKAQKVLGYQELVFLDLKDEQLDDKTIDILVPLEEVFKKVKPQIVYLNHSGDTNQDHKASFNAGIIACRSFANKDLVKVLSYEVLSSTDQIPPLKELAFLPGFYVNIEKYLNRKIEAMRCYQDEYKNFPHPRSAEAIRALAKKRGMEVGFKAAEAFVVLREKWL
jgi:LmbE family N-acetylglucosaminyl deacetylase